VIGVVSPSCSPALGVAAVIFLIFRDDWIDARCDETLASEGIGTRGQLPLPAMADMPIRLTDVRFTGSSRQPSGLVSARPSATLATAHRHGL